MRELGLVGFDRMQAADRSPVRRQSVLFLPVALSNSPRQNAMLASPIGIQFFIMFSPNVGLWGKYTVLGRVISGMDAVDGIAVGEPPAEPTKIVKATLGA